MTDEKIDIGIRNQWRIFVKGCETPCPRCRLLFRFTIAGPWVLMVASITVGPWAGYQYRNDWIGAVSGFLIGLLGTHLFSLYWHQFAFAYIKRCAASRIKQTIAYLKRLDEEAAEKQK